MISQMMTGGGDRLRHRSGRLLELGPGFGEIKPIGNGQTGMMIGDGQRNSHLAIGLLAELPLISMRDANRMNAMLWKARVVDHPSLDGFLLCDFRQPDLTNLGENVPVGVVRSIFASGTP